MIWHSEPLDAVLNELNTDANSGLSDEQVAALQAKHDKNLWTVRAKRRFIKRLALQITNPAVIFLTVASAIAAGILLYKTGFTPNTRWWEPLLLIGITLVTALLGAVQEHRAEKTLDSLRFLSAANAKVLRNGAWVTVSSAELVPGDIVEVKEGDLCPADCRLLSTEWLTCDECILTEDDVPAKKDAEATPDHIAPMFKRANMLYAGCAVTGGVGQAVVCETATNTELGKRVAMLIPDTRTEIPLQGRLVAISRTMAWVVAAACVLFLIIGLIWDLDLLTILTTIVAMAVAIIPEGLAAVSTLVLAVGVERMLEKHAAMRRIPAVDTLSQVSVICADKTGVLTLNQPILKSLFVGGKLYQLDDTNRPDATVLVRLAAICSNPDQGDLFDDAILQAAETIGMSAEMLNTDYPRVSELPFDRERKRMTTVHLFGDQLVAIVKGAPETVLDLCASVELDSVANAYVQMGNNGQHVLAVAYKYVDNDTDRTVDELESDLNFAGLIGLEDAVCPRAVEALRECEQAGILPIMITGDHVTTATAVAKKLGILQDESQAIDGAKVAAMSDEELAESFRQYRVYARVAPTDKCRIVKAWQQAGETVAVTGRGVRDIAALRTADVGCALGVGGDDAACGTADMVLTDNHFTGLAGAICCARGVYATMMRVVRFFLACNIGELLVMLIGLIAFGVPALSPILLLWVNLVTDTLPALAFGAEPIDRAVMNGRMRRTHEPLILNKNGVFLLIDGLVLTAITLIAYSIGRASWALDAGAVATTMAFAVLATAQLVQMLALRSSGSIFRVNWLKNPQMLIAFIVGIGLIGAVLFVPSLQALFGLAALTNQQIAWCAGLSIVPLIVTEIGKIVDRMVAKQ